MPKISLLVFVILIHLSPDVLAQPFDTLLTDYKYIHEIYPLEDGSFILVGQGDKAIVERIDSSAKRIWSVSFGKDQDDYLNDHTVHLLPNDSTIQIAMARKECDYYDTSDIKVYTISFQGQIMDSLLVLAKELPWRITLLSGNSIYPRLGYIVDKEVVLQFVDGDTLHIRPGFPGGDTMYSLDFGRPRLMAMCPGGDIHVGTESAFISTFGFENGKYKVIDVSFAGIHPDTRDLLCVEDEFHLVVNSNDIQLYDRNSYPVNSFYLPNVVYLSTKLHWPYLNLMAYSLSSQDSLYVLDHFLNKVHQQPWPNYEQYISGFAVRNQTTFTVGNGSAYFEGGFLGSENLITHEGPKFYDIELVDFEIGPYDSVYWEYGPGPRYVYTIPDAYITIKNNSDYTVNEIQVIHTYRNTFCADGNWVKEIQQMDLQPGETNKYELHDIYIVKEYPFSQWHGACITAFQPDKHADDVFGNNDLCKKLDFIPTSFALQDFPIQHTPPAIADEIGFIAPQEFEFDLAIYDMNGIRVFQSEANSSSGYTVNLSFLSPGIYIFQYYLTTEGKTYVEKILKY